MEQEDVKMNIRCPDCGCPGFKKRWVGLKPSIHSEDWHVSCMKCGHEYIARVGDDNVPYQIFDEPKETEEWPAKPCPFCGGERFQYTVDYEGVYAVRCTCGAEAPAGDTVDEAMENWNRRPETVLIPEGVDPNVFKEAIKKMADEPVKFITKNTRIGGFVVVECPVCGSPMDPTFGEGIEYHMRCTKCHTGYSFRLEYEP